MHYYLKRKKNVSGFVEHSHLQFNRAPDISENSFECSQYFPTVVVIHMWINMHIFLIIYFGNILLTRLKYCFCDFFQDIPLYGLYKYNFMSNCFSTVDGYSHQCMNICSCLWKHVKMIDLLKMPHFLSYFMVLMSDTLKYYHFLFYLIFLLSN